MTGERFDGKRVLLSSFRNEAPFVLEFVAHHKGLGFDEIIIASNDCTDGTAEILDALAARGVIRHIPCQPPPNIRPQAFAYAQIRQSFPVDQADWLMILDADEFLNIHIGDGTLTDLIATQADADLVLINWACFGSGGQERWVDEPTASRFLLRLRTLEGNGPVKTLIRQPRRWKQFSNHHPFGWLAGGSLRLAFAAGLWTEDVAGETVEFGTYRSVKTRVGSFRFAQINHYLTRTVDSFDLRRARGHGDLLHGKQNMRHTEDYFRRMSAGSFFDDTILRYADEVAKRIADYRSDARLAAAADNGLRLYEAEIECYWQARGSA